MSFEQNLQTLRTRKKLTQEQLAEQLGVSRQSVSKWESGASFPELNTIITLCDMFDVSMDDLLRGSVEHSFAEDTEIYDAHMKRFGRGISAGVGLVLAGTGIGAALDAFSVPGNILGMVFLLVLVAAVTTLVSAGMEHANFMRRHPQLHLRYTEAQEEEFDRRFIRTVTGSIGALLGVLAVIAGLSFLDGTLWEDLLGAFFMFALVGVAVPLIDAGIQKMKYDAARAQKKEIPPEPLSVQTPEEQKQRKNKVIADRICECIMLVVIAVFLGWSFVAQMVFSSPVWHISWIVFPVGALLCAVISTAMGTD